MRIMRILQKFFLKELHNKVRQFEEILNIEHKIDQRLIYFSFERKKIKI